MKNKKHKFLLATLIAVVVVILVIVFRQPINDFFKLFSDENPQFQKFLHEHKYIGSGVIILLEVFQVLIAILPSEALQLVSGIAFGWIWGTLLIVTGVFIGSQIYYFAYRFLKKSKKSNKNFDSIYKEVEHKISHDKTNIGAIIALLFLAPGITYGVISLIAISFDLKWHKYTLYMLLGSLIPIAVEVSMASQVASSSAVVSSVFLSIILAMVVYFFFFKKEVLNFILKPKKPLDEKINKYKTKRPSRFLYGLMMPILNKTIVKRNNTHFVDNVGIKQIKQPILFLCNHPSKIDYVYFCKAIEPHKPQIVVNRYFYHDNLIRPLLRAVGCIPKKQFQSDMYAMKEIIKMAREGRDIAIWPEGMNTYCGSVMPILPGIDKLIKHLGIQVVVVKISGAYLTHGKLRKNNAHGKIEVTVDNLLSVEDIKKLTTAEIFEKVKQATAFNEFEWASQNKIEFSAEDLSEGMDGIVYKCPRCLSEYKIVSGNHQIKCEECGNGATVNKYYEFVPFDDKCVIPKDLPAWFEYQREVLAKDLQDENFEFENTVILKMFIKKGKEKEVGKGVLKLDKNGLSYRYVDGAEVKFTMPFSERSQITLNVKQGVEFYYNDVFYCFEVKNPQEAVKWAIYYEESHKKHVGEK